MNPRARLWEAIWRAVVRFHGDRFVRLRILLICQRIGKVVSGQESPLTPSRHKLDLDPEHIRNPTVRRTLRGEKLTAYGMDVCVINCLCEFLEAHQVCDILEFGSGISTLVLASLLAGTCGDAGRSRRARVLSVDESEEYSKRTCDLLRSHGLENAATVVHCPLGPRVEYGQSVTGYVFDSEKVAVRLPGWRPELVLVDGPSTGSLSRAVAVCDALKSFAGIRYVLMDDALRIHEINCMRYLQALGLVRFEGVIPKGKGLALGNRNYCRKGVAERSRLFPSSGSRPQGRVVPMGASVAEPEFR